MGNEHHRFMQMALDEAKKGLGRTSPNPAVGAVVVAEGEVVGRGYHQKAGTPHAEVHALADAGPAAKGAALCLTLVACSPTRRTPPSPQAMPGSRKRRKLTLPRSTAAATRPPMPDNPSPLNGHDP